MKRGKTTPTLGDLDALRGPATTCKRTGTVRDNLRVQATAAPVDFSETRPSPLVAIRYQILVVFMLAVAIAVGSSLFVRLAVGRHLTPAHQLRRYLL